MAAAVISCNEMVWNKRLQRMYKETKETSDTEDKLINHYSRIFPSRRGFGQRVSRRLEDVSVVTQESLSPMEIIKFELPEGFKSVFTEGSPYVENEDLTETKEIVKYVSLVYGDHFKLTNIVNWSETGNHFKNITLYQSIFSRAINFLQEKDKGEVLNDEILFTYEAFRPVRTLKRDNGEIKFVDSQRHTTNVKVKFNTREDGSKYIHLDVSYEYCFEYGGGAGCAGFVDITNPKVMENFKSILELLESS